MTSSNRPDTAGQKRLGSALELPILGSQTPPRAPMPRPSGDAPVVSFVSLGCAKNLVDSEKMLGQLAESGVVLSGDEALADTLVGFGSAWIRTIFVTDNLLISGVFVLVAAWVRDVIQVLASNQLAGKALLWQLLAQSPLAALSTAAAALVVRLFFRTWLVEKSA